MTIPQTRGDHHAGPVEPVAVGTALVMVDGRPICAVCGNAVYRLPSGRWRHGRPLTSAAIITRARLRRLTTYEEFATRFPWAARAGPERRHPVGPEDWREARRRLERYGRLLREVSRRRSLRRAENPYLLLVASLAQSADAPIDPAIGAAITNLPNWGLVPGIALLVDLPARRRELASRFSWAIPTDHALDVLARHAPLVEGGAGMGYWAALLRARGVDIVAYDIAPPGVTRNEFHLAGRKPWTDVRAGSYVSAAKAHPARTLVLCWPPYDDESASYEPLRAYRGETIAFVGERGEGAAGSVRFHRELALNWTLVDEVALPRWPGLADGLYVYRRNERRQPHTVRDRCPDCGRITPTGSLGRCDACFAHRPPALAVRAGRHRVEYTAEQLAEMPVGLRLALERSPNRIS
jgi:hypothetical protein